MRVKQLSLYQYRNLREISLSFHEDTNLIYGANAQGKTNLLESLCYLSTGKSFRGSRDQELILMGQTSSCLEADLDLEDRSYRLKAELFLGKRRKLTRNQVFCKNSQEFSEIYQTVLFCPEDLELVKGAPVLRRRFLDGAIGQLRPQYQAALWEYQRLYQHKLKILKTQTGNMLAALPDFNFRLCQTGAMIVHYRAHFLKRLGEIVPKIHEDFAGSGEKASIFYQTVSTIEDPLAGQQKIFQQILAHQESHYHAELASGRCLTGPHKDDLILEVNDLLAKQFASQGQTRTLALSLKLAQRDIFFQETGEHPVLLLDDVLSELDPSRQEFVLNRIQSGQVFITCCQDEKFLGLKEGAKFRIHGGCLEH